MNTPPRPWTPDTLRVAARHVEVDGAYVATLTVIGYPREVYAGWLQPLLTYPGRVDVSVHIDPVDQVSAAHHLKRRLAGLEAARRQASDHERLADPSVDTAAEDAQELAERIARGEDHLVRVGLVLAVHAATEATLADEVAAVAALASSLLIDARPTTYRAVPGWISGLPLGLNRLGGQRTMDTSALAAAFPFTSPDLPGQATPDGVLYGHNLGGGALVCHDRFGAAADNYNSVILGRSGSGKSYLVKLELLRSLYRGIAGVVIDPEDEYARLCHAVGGTHLRLGAAGVRLNPFDLPITRRPDGRRTAAPDTLTRHALFLHTVLGMLLGADITPADRAILDQAILATYQRAGITTDPATWTRPAPLLADLATVLADHDNPAAGRLATRLHPYTAGAFRSLFDGPTTTAPHGHLVVISLRDLPAESRAIGTLLALDAVWRQVTDPTTRRARLVVVDEAWLLMKDPAGAEFLLRLAKSARKHFTGLTIATQDVEDLLGSPLGRPVITNAATQVVLRQAPQALDAISAAFGLTDGERRFVGGAERGCGLLCVGTNRVPFAAAASPTEHALITTDPAELAHTHWSGASGDTTTDPVAPDPAAHTDTAGWAVDEHGHIDLDAA